MAHFEQLGFVGRLQNALPARFRSVRVLEVGSWDVNGSVRSFFSNAEYIGADVAEGPCVDIVQPGQDLDFPSRSFDTVITCECFEHNPFWLESFVNMHRMLKPGGLFVMTCAATGRAEHGTSRAHTGTSLSTLSGQPDYYQNLCERDFKLRLNLQQYFSFFAFSTNVFSNDLYFAGVRRGSDVPVVDRVALDSVFRDAWRLTRREKVSGLALLKAILVSRGKRLASRLLGEPGYHNISFFLRRSRVGRKNT
jgi:SAM-dependent methyltransferase